MVSWNINQKHEPSSINNGNRYEKKDRFSIENVNAITENSFYAVNKAEEAREMAENAFLNDGTVTYIDGVAQKSLNFSSDPQTQINSVVGTANENARKLQYVEQVEVIYDKDDSTKDWGYSGGINSNGLTATTVGGKDFSKYKYLKVYVFNYSSVGENGFGEIIVRLDLLTTSNTYSGRNVIGITTESGIVYNSTQVVTINQDKTELRYIGANVYSNGGFSNGAIYKIEGVY